MDKRYLQSTALLGALLMTPAAVRAQADPEPQVKADAPLVAAPDQSEKATGQTDIVVTGSRIRRSNFDTLEPTAVVSSQYLQDRGITNIADALNEQPGFGVPQNTDGGQSSYGVSQNFVNKFGLGTARTLTLVDGRRFVSTNAPTVLGNPAGLQVDLNVIPSIMVDHIDNVAIGGAPTYGSDAIAGTINVILKKDFEGLEVQALSGITERGDNFRANGAALWGTSFGPDKRGHVMVSFSYDQSDGVRLTDRERGQEALTFQTNPLAGSASATIPGRTTATDGRVNPNVPFNGSGTTLDGIPNTVLIRNTRIFAEDASGLILPVNAKTGAVVTYNADGTTAGFGANGATRLQFDSSGNIVPFNPGIPFGNTYGSGGDGFNLTSTTPLTNDLKRYTAYLTGDYELADHVKLFWEGTYYHGEGREIIDQPVYNSPLFSGANGPLLISATDPRLSAQAKTTLAGLGISQFYLSRDSIDITNSAASSTTNVYRGVGGLTGDFDALGKSFTYEVSANYGRTQGAFYQTVLNQQHFVNAVNVTTSPSGAIVCNPTPAFNAAPGTVKPIADPSCVPLNVFGLGAPSQQALGYITQRIDSHSVLVEQDYNANFGSSDIVHLWSGGVGFNLGYEHRNEYGKFSPDTFLLQGLGRSAAITGNVGSFHTDEAYGELLIPLMSPDNHVPLIRTLEIEAHGRYVNNSVNGGFWTYTYGGRYEPVKGIEFRGNFTRSLRAPSIVELFTPQTTASSFFPDPCDAANLNSGTNPTIRQRNCAAFFKAYGLTAGQFNSLARTSSVPSITGGNPNLQNEVANSYTYGVVLRPSFVPRFELAVDWNRILVTGNIASLTSANIAEGCYDNPNFNLANPDAGNAFCTQFTRVHSSNPDQNGQIVSDPANPGIRTGFVNGSFMLMKGLTAEANYSVPLSAIHMDGSHLYLGGTFFYLDTLTSSNNGVTVNPLQGSIGYPRYSGQVNVSLTTPSGFGATIQGNYTSSSQYNLTYTADSQDILKLSSQWLFNLSLSQKIGPKATMRFSVTNLFDTAPPFPYAGTAAYDMLGRRFTVSVDLKF